MELSRLEKFGACYDAKEWFKDKFGKFASTKKVLVAAIKEQQPGWVTWYICHGVESIEKKDAVEFFKKFIIARIKKEFSKLDKEQCKAFLVVMNYSPEKMRKVYEVYSVADTEPFENLPLHFAYEDLVDAYISLVKVPMKHKTRLANTIGAVVSEMEDTITTREYDLFLRKFITTFYA